MFEITNELLIMVLTFVLVFFVTSQALGKFLRQKFISIIVGLIFALLAVRYLSYSQIDFIFQTYGQAGMWLLILVPFSMVFFFVYSSDMLGIFRKAIWVFYGVVTVSVLQSNNTFYSESVTSIILGVIVAMILIILFDNYIQSKLNTWRNLRRTR